MILDCANAEAASQLTADSGWKSLSNVTFTGATLVGVIELARVAIAAGEAATNAVAACVRGQAIIANFYSNVVELHRGGFDSNRPREFLFSAPAMELWKIHSDASLADPAFELYIQRFDRSLRQNGFGDRFPKALAKAFLEMIDNVIRHGSADLARPATGIVGYHVIGGLANFVVADLGQGALTGLRGNPRWSYLPDEQAALVAVARDGATRMSDEVQGFGFKQVFKSFLDREGVVALRSGDGVAVLRGNTDRKAVETCSCAHAPGFRVCAYFSLAGDAKEIEISY